MNHVERAEEVDREVLIDHRAVEITAQRNARVADENVEGLDLLDCRADLRSIGHVEGEWHHAPVGMTQGCPGSGVDPARAAAQHLVDQCPTNAAIGAGNQNSLPFDRH